MDADESSFIQIRLLVVDDHALVRKGLASLLRRDVRFIEVKEACDVNDAIRTLANFEPDLILLDNHMPGVRGIDAISTLKEMRPSSKVLMLTISGDENDLSAALLAGADGYLLKTIDPDQLSNAIIRQLDGEPVISPELMSKLIKMYKDNQKPRFGSDFSALQMASSETDQQNENGLPECGVVSLTSREKQILALIARGDSNKLIGRELEIAETTVKIHVQHILRKLNLTSRVQIAVFAVSCGVQFKPT